MAAKDYGAAVYMNGRNRKNPILVYTSQSDRTKVYEFMISTKFKRAGLVSWKCVACCKIRNDYRALGETLNRKIPLILVDNDIIKENPEQPLNAEHFCNGRDAIDVLVTRAKLQFIAKSDIETLTEAPIVDIISDFSKKAVANAPLYLTTKERKLAQKDLDGRCRSVVSALIRKKRTEAAKAAALEASTSGPVDPETVREEKMRKFFEQSREEEPEEPEQGCSARLRPADDDTYFAPPVEKKVRLAPPPKVDQLPPIAADDLSHGDFIFGDSQDVAYDIELV